MQELKEFEQYAQKRFNEFVAPKKLFDAAAYSLFSSGKRIRPSIMFAVTSMKKFDYQKVFPLALALEMVHTYSLIHDDLPCMDNDVLRRGKPTNHIAFDEATALLAGDALLSQSFEILTEVDVVATEQVKLIQKFAQTIGISGMVAGQIQDIALDQSQKEHVSLNELKAIHEQKTGKLFEFAILAPTYIFDYSLSAYTLLESFAKNMGILFQAMDDYLDILKDVNTGKTHGIDQRNGKITYLSFFTKEELESYLKDLEIECNQILHLLELEGYNTLQLKQILDIVLRK